MTRRPGAFATGADPWGHPQRNHPIKASEIVTHKFNQPNLVHGGADQVPMGMSPICEASQSVRLLAALR